MSRLLQTHTHTHARSVGAGEAKVIPFSFEAPPVKETYGLDVGQWARTWVTCILKGGYARDEAPETKVRILLEGHIQI